MEGNWKADDVKRINTPIDKFFRVWVEFLTPIHNLTNKEKEVFAALLKHRFELQASITNEDLLDSILMGRDVRAQIRQECNVSSPFFQGILGKFKRNKVIVEDRINPKFIPKGITKDSKSFKFLIYFDFNAGNN